MSSKHLTNNTPLNIPTLPPEQRRIHELLTNDFKYFAKHVLKIKNKDGDIVPFIFNRAQQHLHDTIEKQVQTMGKVRIFLVKARQWGGTTYAQGRIYWKVRSPGRSAFTIAHIASTTEHIYGMVKRYHEHCPEPLRPTADVANTRIMKFSEIDSSYVVGTAGSAKVGVGGTFQEFHGSEVALWENEKELIAGVLQTVPDRPKTSIIFESTARGMGNEFYRGCMNALHGRSEYKLVFVPWFWIEDYTDTPPNDFTPTTEEMEIAALYELSSNQLYWRRKKIVELGDWMFRREYPSHVMEAFQTSAASLISAEKIVKARKATTKDPHAPKILGVDPSGEGKDECVVVQRQGLHMHTPIIFNNIEPMLLAAKLAAIIDRENIDKCFIDVAYGYGVISRLKQLGYGDIVLSVHFNERAMEFDTYANKRSEMIHTVRDWIHNVFGDGQANVPDSDEVMADLTCVPPAVDSINGLLKLVPKEKIKKDYGKSPGILDALALTFAYPVRRILGMAKKRLTKKNSFDKSNQNQSSLSTLNRLRKNSGNSSRNNSSSMKYRSR